jgi:hypothetical protein
MARMHASCLLTASIEALPPSPQFPPYLFSYLEAAKVLGEFALQLSGTCNRSKQAPHTTIRRPGPDRCLLARAGPG